jgi:hypothetical protein
LIAIFFSFSKMEMKIDFSNENFLKIGNEITNNSNIDMNIGMDESTNNKYNQLIVRSVNSSSEREKAPRSNLKNEGDIEQHEVLFFSFFY